MAAFPARMTKKSQLGSPSRNSTSPGCVGRRWPCAAEPRSAPRSIGGTPRTRQAFRQAARVPAGRPSDWMRRRGRRDACRTAKAPGRRAAVPASGEPQRTPRRSAASANSGQRASSRASGQLTAAPPSAASTSGPQPVLSCMSASSARSGWVAAALTTSPSRQTAACAPEHEATFQAASSASLFSDPASPPLVRLSSSAASCPNCSIGTRSSVPGSRLSTSRAGQPPMPPSGQPGEIPDHYRSQW